MLEYKAISAGYAARQLIFSSGACCGSVHSVFRQAVNITTSSGRLFSLSTLGTPNHPANVETSVNTEDFRDLGIEKGQPCHCLDQRIYLGRLMLHMGTASTYFPLIRRGGSDPGQPDSLRARGSDLLSTLHAPRLRFEEGLLRYHYGLSLETDVINRTLPHIYESLRLGKNISIPAKQIIGLGPGLTPSGDDVLAGAMATFLIARRSLCNSDLPSPPGFTTIVHQSKAATNFLSSEMLCYAAQGELSEVAETFIAAVLSDNIELTKHAAKQLGRYGETSGQDLMVGIMCGLDAWLSSRV